MQRLGIFLFCIICCGCLSNEPAHDISPAIEKEKFIKVLTDIHVVEVSKGSEQIDKSKFLSQDIDVLYGTILSFHQVDEAAFRQTFNYYLEFPAEMVTIYEEVMLNLSAIENEIKERDSKK